MPSSRRSRPLPRPGSARKYAERPTTRKPTALLTHKAAAWAAFSHYPQLSQRFTVAPSTANLQQKIARWLQKVPLPLEEPARNRAFHDRFDNLHCESGNFWVELPTAAELI